MNILSFKKLVSSLVMIAYTTLTSLVPMGKALAAPVCDASNPTTAAGATPGCAVKNFPTGAYAYSKFEWNQVGELDQTPTSGISLTMASGDRVAVSNNRTASALGLQASQVADVMTLFPTNVPFVFARYNPQSMELRVDVFKIEKTGSKMKMLQAPFTPAHGGAFAAAMTYATASDRQLGNNAGANPFALYLRPGLDAFYNVGSLAAVQVAVGHAMRMAGASIGLVAIAKSRVNQYATSSGGWFKKTTTTHVEGWTKPEWYVATPRQFQPNGLTASVCAIQVEAATDCPPQLVVPSGVSWTQWEGGNLPAFEDMTSEWSESKSSFTLLAWVVVIFLVVLTAGALLVAAGSVATAIGPATFIQSLAVSGPIGGATLTMNAALAMAAIEAAAVGVVGGMAGAGLTDAVDGPYQGARAGFDSPMIPDTSAGRSVYEGVKANFDDAPLSAMGVRAVTQAAYGVNCAPGAKSTDCASSGVVPRPDSAVETNNVQFWKDNGGPMVITAPLINND
jgi:hypothetical protein